jgi:predicted AAA+ superfamily ATPase
VAILTLLGFSRREAHGQARKAQPFLPRATSSEDPFEGDEAPSLADLYTEIWRGAFPALHADPAPDRDLFYRSYVQTYLSRDVRDLAGTVDETRFLRFIKACAARTGNLLNLADLARDAGISPPTARAWLNILVTSFQVHLLEPWHTNRTKRLVRRPKLYFLDTGLCAYLGAWRTPEALESGAQSGAILETYVVTEILKSYWHFGRDAPLYFFRDRDGREIDLLIEQDGRLHPVEIKRAASPTRRWVRAFHALDRLGIPRGRGAVVSLVRRPVPIDAENDALPAGCL